MEDHLSPAAQRVLHWASRRARSLGLDFYSPLDVLAGLLAEEDCRGGILLASHCRQLVKLKETLTVSLTETDDELPPPDGEVRRGVFRARELSLGVAGLTETGTEELMLGMLDAWSDGESFCAEYAVALEFLLEDFHARSEGRLAPISAENVRLEITGDIERVPRARMIDANLNRASEGLRVAEDFVRFVLNDRNLSARIKNCRHGLREAAAFLPDSWRIDSRDADDDVGVDVRTPDEMYRETLVEVAIANIKRAQEAIRSLEETAKLDNSLAAQQFSKLRYECYSIEQLIHRGDSARRALAGALVYWLAEPDACVKTFEWTTKEVLDAGVRIIQYREKQAPDLERLRLAEDLRRWTEAKGAKLIINDRPDLARLVGADGVHVGQDDLPVRKARSIIGPDRIVGVSTHSLAQIRAAESDGADYIGVGPVFPSQTKFFDSFPGVEYVREASLATSLTQFCIGGITPENVEEILKVGGQRVALGRAISRNQDPSRVVRSLLAILMRD